MNKSEQIYRELQQHLDKHTIGYPATISGVEIKILKRFFNPEEAQLVMHLTHKPTSVEHIHDLTKDTLMLSIDRLQAMLDNMATHGVIGLVEKQGKGYFFTIPFIVGMYEGQLKRLTPEFLADVEQYTSSKAFGLAFLSTELPQMRTIPVAKSISVEHNVTTYDQLEEIINSSDGPFAILECICRKSSAMKGKPCRITSRHETCMAFGDIAKIFIRNESGREIDKAEALKIASMNESDGLVLQPSNTQKVDFVCACCGCCCGMLRVQKKLPKPVEFWATNYHASVNSSTCNGCGICISRCQVDALSIEKDINVSCVNLDRCIGCGNCVVTCPTGAMTLIRKDKESLPPEDSEKLYDAIMNKKKGTIDKIKIAAKLILKK